MPSRLEGYAYIVSDFYNSKVQGQRPGSQGWKVTFKVCKTFKVNFLPCSKQIQKQSKHGHMSSRLEGYSYNVSYFHNNKV
jgi:hypothetical protein